MSNNLSKKEWLVLNYFIENESKVIQKQEKKKESAESIQSFLAYPAKIESDLSGNVSRVTVGKTCKKLLKMGILNAKNDYSGSKGGKTEHYCLKSDLRTISVLLQLITNEYNIPGRIKILSNQYFMSNINESLVKEVLSKKNVTISRQISLLEWNEKEIERICNSNLKIDMMYNISDDFKITMQSSINEFEERHRKDEVRYVDKLRQQCDYFFQNCDDKSINSTRYYNMNVYRSMKMMKKSHLTKPYYECIFYNDIPSYNFELPVFADNVPMNQKMIEIKELNHTSYLFNWDHVIDNDSKRLIEYLIKKIDADWIKIEKIEKIDGNKTIKISYEGKNILLRLNDENTKVNLIIDDIMVDELIAKTRYNEIMIYNFIDEYSVFQTYYSGIENHYEIFQYEKMVLPILALIQASPSALTEFLCGNWDSFDLRFDYSEKCTDYKLISKLLWIAINDFLVTHQIPANGMVERVYSRAYPPHNTSSKISDCWSDLCRNASSLEDIAQMCSFLVIRLKNIYDISFNPGFHISSDSQSTPWSTISKNIRPDLAIHLLKVDHIEKPKSIISKLKDTKNPMFNHIRSKMSNIMQNTIIFYDSDESPSVEFQKMLVDELNLAFISGDFYSEKIFSDIIAQININETPLKYTHTKISDVVKHLSEHRYSRKEIINKRHHYNSSNQIYYNRLIFDSIFVDELEPDESHIQREN